MTATSKPPVSRKLDLACGQVPRIGFEGVDIYPGAQHVVNLQQYPWPFEDESVLEIHCSHYIEHIPMVEVTTVCVACSGKGERKVQWDLTQGKEVTEPAPYSPFTVTTVQCTACDRTGAIGRPKDALFAFFDECYRILAPEGWLHVVVPAHRSDRAFQDPTHRRFITAQTFAYMSEQVRREWKLDHYNVDCNFVGDCNPVVDASMNLRVPEIAQRMIQREWNTVIDWTAKMQKKPRLPAMVP